MKKKRKIITKWDVGLFAALMAASFLSLLVPLLTAGGGGDLRLVITVGGSLYGTYSLDQDRTIVIDRGENENVAVIRDGTVFMDSATCKNQICVNTAPINRAGEEIICLPNQVVLRLEGTGEEEGYDAIAK